jgi:methyl-accepting chemotaxis protein
MIQLRLSKDPVLRELIDRLSSLDQNCLTDLDAGISAMAAGDLTHQARPVTTPILTRARSEQTQQLVDIFNSMLGKTQGAMEGYEFVRETHRAALGDRSCLNDLQTQLASLSDNCVTNLGSGLEAMTRGDLTADLQPVTSPLAPRGSSIGRLGETFNEMLTRIQAGLRLYNTPRTQIAGIVGEISSTSDELSASAEAMSTTSHETSRAIEEIARAISGVAEGAERQVQMIVTAQSVTEEAVQLGESARQVADQGVRMTDQIASIADQTNLLALNAAIEAARATEQVSASTDQTSASTQQVSASSEELARTANHLKQLVSRFVI